jgi:erythrocyte band 7 integral membrane protein
MGALYRKYFPQRYLLLVKVDLILGAETEKNLSAAAKQKRLAEAKIISAKADVESAKMLREAAEVLDSKAAMQIRYLEMIQDIAMRPAPKLLFLNLRGK